MKDDNSENYLVITALIVVLAAFIFCWKFAVPRYKEHKQQLETAKIELETASKKLEALKNAKTTLSTLGDITDKMLVAIPEDPDIPNLISELEAIAIRNRSYIPSIEVSPADEVNKSIEVAFSVTGGFADLHNFISSLEDDVRFINIKNLTVSSSGSTMTLSVSLDAYYRGPITTGGA